MGDPAIHSSKRKREEQEEGDTSKEGSQKKTKSDSEDDVGKDAIDKLEASAELAKRTRASRPFIIPSWVRLREYQQIGLN